MIYPPNYSGNKLNLVNENLQAMSPRETRLENYILRQLRDYEMFPDQYPREIKELRELLKPDVEMKIVPPEEREPKIVSIG